MGSRRFESNLLTWPGRPNTHTWGSTSRFPHATFPFNSRCTEQAHRPRLQESTPRYDVGSWAFLHPHVAAWEQHSKTVGSMFRPRCNPVLKLIDYHISRHVVSTFQTLNHHYHTLRPYPFSLNRRGITSTIAPPVNLILQCVSIQLLWARKWPESLDFYWTVSIAN